jgi:hypothetical protein
MLAAQELRDHPTLTTGTLFDAVIGLRPEFLAGTRDMRASGDEPGVIVDGNAHGGVDALRSIPVQFVIEVRRLRPADAIIRYGRDYRNGAIIVTTAQDHRPRGAFR